MLGKFITYFECDHFSGSHRILLFSCVYKVTMNTKSEICDYKYCNSKNDGDKSIINSFLFITII